MWLRVLLIPGMALVPIAVAAQTSKGPPGSVAPATPGPANAVMPGFETLPDGSTRLFVDLSGPVSYETKSDRASTSYVLKGTRVARKNNCNPLVTEYFNTPVTTARLVPHGHDLWLVTETRAKVDPAVSIENEADGGVAFSVHYPPGDYLPAEAHGRSPWSSRRPVSPSRPPRRRPPHPPPHPALDPRRWDAVEGVAGAVDSQPPLSRNLAVTYPVLRLAHADDEPFLLTMLFYAAHADHEAGARPEQLLTHPALARYVVGFGRGGDLGVVAEAARGPLGAAWVRVLAGDDRGYGWVDDDTPELVIAVAPETVGGGLGTRMMRELLGRARGRYPGVSLSVRADNPARRLYLRLGFVPIKEVTNRVGGISETMVLRFAGGE